MHSLQVLYVPSAKVLIEGGTFHQHESGGWDNPINARLILMGLLHHHEALLNSLPAPSHKPASTEQPASGQPSSSEGSKVAASEKASTSHRSLGDVMREAMDPLKEDLPVQAVLDAVEVFLSQDEVCRCSSNFRALSLHRIYSCSNLIVMKCTF